MILSMEITFANPRAEIALPETWTIEKGGMTEFINGPECG